VGGAAFLPARGSWGPPRAGISQGLQGQVQGRSGPTLLCTLGVVDSAGMVEAAEKKMS